MERVYLDTNVLFPMTLMDLMLSMAEDFHHDVIWTDHLLAEWERVIVRDKRRTPEQAAAITAAIRHAFPDGHIAPERYESGVASIPGPDDDDRMHAAAAIAGGATTLITTNTHDFDASFLGQHGVHVETPDEYLLRRLRAAPQALVDTVERVVGLKHNPPWTIHEYIQRLEKAGAPQFATALRSYLNP